jgi:preprotein translocase subunit SecB
MQEIQNDYISEFRLNDIRITNMLFHHEKDEISKLKFRFEPTYEIEKDIKVTLFGKVYDEQGDFDLEITLVAYFSCAFTNVPDDIKEILTKKNTLSIMFPYLRSQITLMTSQPNMQPVILPAININAFIDSRKE